MNQEETRETPGPDRDAPDLPEENPNSEASSNDPPSQASSREVDNLPVESIGSYARLGELLTDEEKENTAGGGPGSQS